MAPTRIEAHDGSMRRRSAFTLVELLVVIGVVALLVGLLMPVLSKARQHARTVVCLSNLRQISIATMLYTHETNGYVVPAYCDSSITPVPNWASILVKGKYLTAPLVAKNVMGSGRGTLFCPDGLDDTFTTAFPPTRTDADGARPYQGRLIGSTSGNVYVNVWYAMNASSSSNSNYPSWRVDPDNEPGNFRPAKFARIKKAARTVAFLDGCATLNINVYNRINARHMNRTVTNLSFYDGHAESYLTTRLPPNHSSSTPWNATWLNKWNADLVFLLSQ